MASYTAHVHLRWGDLDAYGHANNAAFITYLEQARVQHFHSAETDRSGVDLLDTGIVVVEHRIRYRRQVAYSTTPLRIEVWTDDIRPASYRTHYEVWNEASGTPELAATAETLLAPIDFATGRPRRLSPAERAFVERYRRD